MVTDLSNTYTKPEDSVTPPKPKAQKVNLLLDIPPVVRISIIIFYLVYKFFFPLKTMFTGDYLFEDILIRILKLFTNFLLYAPIMFRWKGVGLLHPLVWPMLFGIAKSVKDPSSYIAPFMSGDVIASPLANQITISALDASLKLTVFSFLAIVFTYLGYYVTTNRVKFKLGVKMPPKNIRKGLILWASICFCIGMGFFFSQGGITGWIDSWGLKGGRTEAMEGLGPILSFIGGLYYIPAIWILVRKKEAIKDPFFIIFAVMFALSAFLATGSRYGVLQALTVYLMAWVMVNRNFPIVKIIMGGFVFLILFGMLGMLRTSGTYKGAEADWNVLDQDASTYLDYTFAEGTKRAQERPDLAVMRRVPNEVDYLYGQSYLYLLSTYIPRAVWKDKPHSGAYYTGYMIFNVPWGIPVGEIGEVYWNFGAIGFLLFFMFKGFIYKMFVNSFVSSSEYIAVAILYFMFLFNGGGFGSLNLSDFFREIVFLFVGLKFLRLI